MECDAGWIYDISGGYKTQFDPAGNSSMFLRNQSDAQQSLAVSSSKSGSARVDASGGFEVKADLIAASVSAKFGVGAATEIGWSRTYTFTMNAPPHSTVVGSYGVLRIVTTGHYYYENSHCDVEVDKGLVQTSTPSKFGYNVEQY